MSLLPGLPEKFKEFRRAQWDAIERILETSGASEFMVVNAPTGSGKSLIVVATQMLSGLRVCILTKTKALQDQYERDFGEVACIIKGRNEYPCAWDSGLTADQGPCRAGIKCKLSCAYQNKVKEAIRAKLVVTNYSYWVAKNIYSDGLGNFDILVCDEAHQLPDTIADALKVEVSTTSRSWREVFGGGNVKPANPEDLGEWIAMARSEKESLVYELERLKDTIRGYGNVFPPRSVTQRFSRVSSVLGKISRIAEMDTDQWVVEQVSSTAYVFGPIVIAGRVPTIIQHTSDRLVMTSATVTRRTMGILGIGIFDYLEYPHTFPVVNRRLIHIPTVRVNHRMTPIDERLWLSRIDQVIRSRSDHKGIIHTVSYARARRIMESSYYKDRLVMHEPGEAVKALERFRKLSPPAVLVSPVVGEGYDFPMDECRYQIITKIPFPDTRGEVMKARISQDKGYPSYIAMQNLIQMCGRGTRSETDYCENFILDDNIGWFMRQYADCAPGWFREAFVRMDTIPEYGGGKG